MNKKQATLIGAGVGLALGVIAIGVYAYCQLTGNEAPDLGDVASDVTSAAAEAGTAASEAVVEAVKEATA